MPQYDSSHTGEQVDEAVGITLGNKNKGSNVLPVYLNAYGEAVPVNKDSAPTQNSTNIVESGGVFTQLSTKLPKDWVQPTGLAWDLVKVGTGVTITDCVASNFSNTSYLKSSTFNFSSASNWTMVLPFKTSTDTGHFIYSNNSNFNYFSVAITANNKIKLWLGNNSSTPNIFNNIEGSILQENTSYYLRISKNGTTYKAELSTDLQNWTQQANVTSSVIIPNMTLLIGNRTILDLPFGGSVDLKHISITLDNVTWNPYPDPLYPPSYGAMEEYVEKLMQPLQNDVVAGEGITKNGTELSIDLANDFMTVGKLDNKWSHFYNDLEVGYGQDLVEEMKKAKKSSFNRSAYDIHGTPDITPDGILSGGITPSSSYVGVPLASFAPGESSWQITLGKVRTSNNATQEAFIGLMNVNSGVLLIRKEANNKVLLAVNYYSSTNPPAWGDIATSSLVLEGDTEYSLRVIYDGTSYSCDFSKDGKEWITYVKLNYNVPLLTYDSFKIGAYGVGYPYLGSIDLKDVTITIGDNEVFNANVKGTDVLKPYDFENQGATIDSNDFATGGRILLPIKMSELQNKSWEITGRYYKGSAQGMLFKFGNGLDYQKALRASVIGNGQDIVVYGTAGDASSSFVIGGWGSFGIGVWNYFDYSMKFDKALGTYTFVTYTDSGVKTTKIYTPTSTNKELYTINVNPNTYLILGEGNNTDVYLTGKVDLNRQKLYIDGELVYQACLKIPYSKSIDNKKIVSTEYRDRVIDEYNQVGYTPYYTLQDNTVENFVKVGSPIIHEDGMYETGYGRNSTSNEILFKRFNVNSDDQVIEFEAYVLPVPNDWAWPNQGQVFLSLGANGNVGRSDWVRLMRSVVSGSHFIQIEQTMNGSWVGNSYNSAWWVGRNFEGRVKFRLYYDLVNRCYKCDCYTVNDYGVATFVKTMTCSYVGNSVRGYANFETSYAQYASYGSLYLNSVKVSLDGKPAYQAFTPPNYTVATIRNTSEELLQSTYREDATQFLRQRGTYVAGSTVTLPKPFMDTNYFVSVPTSAKTTVGFTPDSSLSSDGEWIAEGYASL